MKTAVGILFLLMALGLVKTTIPPFIVFCSSLRERAIGKAFACFVAVVLQVALGYLLVTTGIDFIRKPPSPGDVVNLQEFIASIDSANQATRVVNKGPGYSIMSSEDADQMMKHYRQALAHAEKVDADFLEQKYKGWGQHFDREYRAGLRLVIRGNETADARISLSGQQLMDSWGTWFNANVEAIKRLK
ncbi:hypothetical protein [Desulforhabdus sp. TSK]|uniref:hypothetical protein n=1 Tax=Desulforhabdus sp. TSK TaxID=2925014 RepID=UPI001FC7DB37|nr:hypothetical protein [Desulforhabdus sp. TSK]GKT07170.1 hypothetical protein DSTSK_04750 [Desulforhabdus sp. TSK]